MLRLTKCTTRAIGVGVGHGGGYVPRYLDETMEYVSIAEMLKLLQSTTSHPSIGAELTAPQILRLVANAVTYVKATKQPTSSSESNK